MTVDPRLLAILVCPVTRTPLRYDARRQELVSEAAGLAFPVRDGVPILLVEEARPWTPEEEAPPPDEAPTPARP
ncbi:MAG: Trm112 family protein [Sphingomonadaceae bacterium]|nr:Trm112 family protein [Thermaurantiacus sp.]MCS6987788.1 Trm112 family protein [Sphingomonadaceae bacterium]MDW8414992.1 Trm112 family protein [Thermaurantiacus sp.]